MGRQETRRLRYQFDGRAAEMAYLLYRPPATRQMGQLWPAMMFLHGAGERGSDLELVKRHGPPKLIEGGQDLPFLVVSPQCPEGEYWSVEGLSLLWDEIADNYPVDPDRFYVTGISMGGYGTWRLCCATPERFAAAVPICGGGAPAHASRMKDVPVWAFHGALDDIVPLRESQVMVEALSRAGGHARLTVYPRAEHDSWTETYDNPEVFAWMLSQRRLRA